MTGSPKTAKKAAAKPGVSTTVPSTSAASAVSTTTTPAKASTEDSKVNKTTSNPEMSVVTASPGVTSQGGAAAAAAPPVTVVSPPTVARPSGVPPLGVREDTTHHASLFIGDLSPEVSYQAGLKGDTGQDAEHRSLLSRSSGQ